MKNQPLVSIIIPVYNGIDYLAQAIDSALNQTYPNVEIIVVNDGSSDDGATDHLARSYGDKIRYFSKENGGVSSALNFGIEKMKGEYFSWLSHDDIYMPNKIQLSVNALMDFGEDNIVICGTRYINAEGRSILHINRKLKSSYSGLELFRECLINKINLNGCALLIPREAFRSCGTFSDLVFCQDMECWLRMMIVGYKFIVIPDKLSLMRIHRNQVTSRLRDVAFKEREIYYLRLLNFIIAQKEKKKQYVEILSKAVYSSYPSLDEVKKKISEIYSVGFVDKIKYWLKGIVFYHTRRIYYKIKY